MTAPLDALPPALAALDAYLARIEASAPEPPVTLRPGEVVKDVRLFLLAVRDDLVSGGPASQARGRERLALFLQQTSR